MVNRVSLALKLAGLAQEGDPARYGCGGWFHPIRRESCLKWPISQSNFPLGESPAYR